ncbi:MAG: hypothetical protein GTN69_01050 [Armatimonadetes bacterium]|nr:hypothetical protein [Armatimonadota bacterium]
MTLVELMVLLAIGGILVSILVPAFKEAAEKKRTSESFQMRDLPEEAMSPESGESTDGCGRLFTGFALGVGATLLYLRWQAAKKKVGKRSSSTVAETDDDEGGSP